MKRKTYIVDGFKGQNSKDAPEMLAKGEMQVVSGGFVNEDTSYDGDNVGTLSLKTGFSHEPIVIHAWKSSDGNEYVLTWGIESGAGVVNYYNKTSDGAINTTFITAMPIAFPPEFVNWGNEYIVMLAGKFGNYKIAASGGTLTATATTDVSPANFGRVNNGALYLAQETSIIHSAAGDPLRFTPTREERTSVPPVYDLNNRLILSSAGVQGETMGYEIWKGYHIVWTQYDCYIAAWDGAGTAYATKLSGYGLYGMKGWAILDDKLAFYSTYKQASVCYIVTGTAGGNGETFTVGQNLQVSVIEAPGAKKISDILTACPKPTTKKKIIAIDSKEDWDGSKISTDLSATGWDTDTNPGWVGLRGAAKATLTPSIATGYVQNPGGLAIDDIGAVTETGTNLDIDVAPGPYPALTPTPTSQLINFQPTNTMQVQRVMFTTLRAIKQDGTTQEVVDKDRQHSMIVGGAQWNSYVPSQPIDNVTAIQIIFGFHVLGTIPGGTTTRERDVFIIKTYACSTVQSLEKVYLYKTETIQGTFGSPGSLFIINIGEVEMWGFTQSTGVITTGPTATTSLSVAGLAAGTADLGLFQIGYQGYNDDGTGGLVGATAPTAVEVGIGTNTNPATWGTVDNPTASGSMSYMTAAELKAGMKLSRLINATFTFAAGGTLYVRARVPATLQASSFTSPMIDRIIWDFESGSARTSTFPMFTWQHKTLLALMTNSGSTECDRAVAINDNGYCSVIDGVKWMAGFTGPDETIVTAGKTLGKLGEGTDNLIGASSTDTPILKTLTTPKIKGINKVFARKCKFGISKYTAEETNLIDLYGGGGGEGGDEGWPILSKGTNTYIAKSGPGLEVVYTVPGRTAPVQTGSVVPASVPFRPVVDGDYLYLPTSDGFEIYDISDKDDPALVGHYHSVRGVSAAHFASARIIINGNYAYLAVGGYYGDPSGVNNYSAQGFEIVNITDKTAPVRTCNGISTVEGGGTGPSSSGIAANSDKTVVYVVYSDSVDYTTCYILAYPTTNPADIGESPIWSSPSQSPIYDLSYLFTEGIFAAIGTVGVKAFNENNGTVIDTIATPGTAKAVTTNGVSGAGGLIFVADTASVRIYDTSFALVGSYATTNAIDLCLLGDYLYVVDGTDGLLVLDVSTPATPTLDSSYQGNTQIGLTTIFKTL